MTEDWRKRLAESVETSGKTARAISIEAGLDHSYVRSIFKGRLITPTISKLIAICEAIPVSPAYIVSGLHVSPSDEELIRCFAMLGRDRRRIILDLAREMALDPVE